MNNNQEEANVSCFQTHMTCEWAAVYTLRAGRYELSVAEGPYPIMSLVILNEQETTDSALFRGSKLCNRHFSEPAVFLFPGDELPIKCHVSLQLQSSGRKSFYFQAFRPMQIGIFAQYHQEVFNMHLMNANGASIRQEIRTLPSLFPISHFTEHIRVKGALVPKDRELSCFE